MSQYNADKQTIQKQHEEAARHYQEASNHHQEAAQCYKNDKHVEAHSELIS